MVSAALDEDGSAITQTLSEPLFWSGKATLREKVTFVAVAVWRLVIHCGARHGNSRRSLLGVGTVEVFRSRTVDV